MPSLNVSGEVRIMKNYISTWLNISMTINVKEDSRSETCFNILVARVSTIKGMKNIIILLGLSIIINVNRGNSQALNSIKFGNAVYVNLSVGEPFEYHGKTIEVIELNNSWSLIKVNNNRVWLDVAKRSLPKNIEGLQIFVSDQINVKNMTTDGTTPHPLDQSEAILSWC